MIQPSPPAEEPLGLLAAAVRSGVRRLLESRIDPLGVSTQQFWILVGIAEHPCHSQAELADHLRLDEATACRAIRTLAERGWVRTARDGSDRRCVKLALTAEGGRLARTLLPIARKVRAAVDDALTPEERAAARAALVKVVVALQRLATPAPPLTSRRRRPNAARPPETRIRAASTTLPGKPR